MQRAIFLLVLLTAAVTLPPFYSKWSESQRLHRIAQLKHQARPVFGEPWDVVLSDLKNDAPPSVIILYTGATASHLEPCGCYQEQSGGLPKRAYVVDQIRQQGFPTLLVDAGNIFDGRKETDMKRAEVNLKAMSEMRYDLAALSQSDLSYSDNYLSQQQAVATFPFLSVPEKVFAEPFVKKNVGQHNIAFVSGAISAHAVSQADIIVALGNSEASNLIDIVIQPDKIETTLYRGKTLYVGCEPEGRTLGLLALWIDSNGELTRHYATQLALTGDVSESEPIRQLLTDFYRDVAGSSTFTPLFAEEDLESDPQNGYVSAGTCQRCHERAYLQWSATRHAFAFQTLLKKQRYFDPDCLSCHTTGLGYPTGFQINDPDTTLKGVQCETCHGPGKQHVGDPKKTNIRSAADTTRCLKCHDATHSPGFAEGVALHAKDVDHSRSPLDLEELLKSRIKRIEKPTLELFVMSHCPFGIQAQEKIIPIVKRFGEKINFKLQFIAKEKGGVSAQDITPFTIYTVTLKWQRTSANF